MACVLYGAKTMALPQTQPEATKDLVLDSLEIKNFRAFRHLEIPKLGRVNLITGKNNVGKSSLLEALWLYANNGSPFILRQLLLARRELGEPDEDQDPTASVRFLYHGYPDLTSITNPIVIGPAGLTSRSLTLAVMPAPEVTPVTTISSQATVNSALALLIEKYFEQLVNLPFLLVDVDGQTPIPYGLGQITSRKSVLVEPRPNSSRLVKANGLADSELGRLWDAIALTNLEDDVLAALRLVFEGIEKINLRGDAKAAFSARIPYIRASGKTEPVPLRNLGDGVNRLFGITLALVNAKGGLLLLDEVENGLHYSVLPKVWRLIFETARRLNVQVFATTHSWDCIEAFQNAAAESPEDGVLVRLQNKNDDVTATVFDERRLAIATRDQIEVR